MGPAGLLFNLRGKRQALSEKATLFLVNLTSLSHGNRRQQIEGKLAVAVACGVCAKMGTMIRSAKAESLDSEWHRKTVKIKERRCGIIA